MRISWRKATVWLVATMVLSLAACSTSEEKVQKFINKGNALSQQGDYVRAVLEYRNAITIDPDRAESYFLAGQAELKQGKLQEAYGYFMKTVEKQADHVGANIQLGKLLLGARELAKSHERVDLALRTEPNNEQARLLRSGILLAERKVADAKSLLETLLQEGSREIDTFLLLAAAHNQSGDKTAAETVLNRGIEANPGSIPLLVTLANMYLERKDSGKVEQTLRQIMALEPDKSEHVERLAGYYWHEGRKAEAEELMRSLLSKGNEEEHWAHVAAFFLARQQAETARQLLLTGLQQHPKSFRLRFLLKDAYLAGGDFNNALAIQQECLNLDQDNPFYVTAQRGLAELYLRAGNIEEADPLVAAVLKKSANDVDGRLLNGSILLIKGDAEHAIAEFRTVLQARPKDISVYPKLADALVRNRQNNLAIDTIKQGLQIAPEAGELHLALAKLYVLEQKPKDAEAQLRKLVELKPDDPVATMALADFHAANNGQAKAMSLYKNLIVKTPDNATAAMKLSGLQAMGKQEQEAMATVTAALTANPANNGLLEHGVRLALQMGRPADALALIEQRLHRQPSDIFAFILQGEAHAANKNYAASEHSYRKAMALNGGVPDIPVRLARTLVLAGKGEQAIAEAEKFPEGSVAPMAQYILLAELYKQTGKIDQAVAVYDQAIGKYPDNWFMLNNLAYYLADSQSAKEQDLLKAEELAKKARQLAPGNVAVLDTVGWTAYKLGKLDRAKTALTMALAGNPNNPVFNHHLAMVLLKEGKKDEAKVLFEKVVRSSGATGERAEAEKALQGLAAEAPKG